MTPNPLSPYALQKLVGEQYLPAVHAALRAGHRQHPLLQRLRAAAGPLVAVFGRDRAVCHAAAGRPAATHHRRRRADPRLHVHRQRRRRRPEGGRRAGGLRARDQRRHRAPDLDQPAGPGDSAPAGLEPCPAVRRGARRRRARLARGHRAGQAGAGVRTPGCPSKKVSVAPSTGIASPRPDPGTSPACSAASRRPNGPRTLVRRACQRRFTPASASSARRRHPGAASAFVDLHLRRLSPRRVAASPARSRPSTHIGIARRHRASPLLHEAGVRADGAFESPTSSPARRGRICRRARPGCASHPGRRHEQGGVTWSADSPFGVSFSRWRPRRQPPWPSRVPAPPRSLRRKPRRGPTRSST